MIKWIFLVWSICAFIIGIIYLYVEKYSDGEGRQVELQKIIYDAAMVYLQSQYIIIWSAAIFIFFALSYISGGFNESIYFVLGVLISSGVGFIGMFIAVSNNVKVVEQCIRQVIDSENICENKPILSYMISICGSKDTGFKVAFLSGSVIGTVVSLLGLLSILLCCHNTFSMLYFCFGSCFVSLFARLGGGIFTKGADVGADLVGKLELNLPEDDARNPAVIADNVGDNVGDCYGTLLDTFDSFVLAISLCFMFSASYNGLLIGVIGVVSGLLPIFFMKFDAIKTEMERYFIGSVLLFMAITGIVCKFGIIEYNEWLCSSIGALIVFILMKITEYYTSHEYEPVQTIVESSKYGHGTNVISGVSVGLESVLLPIITICGGLLTMFYINQICGIAYGVVGMVSLLSSVLTLDMLGRISDNAGGIAEMSGLDKNVRAYTDQLDIMGNTTKAVTKGFSIGIAILSSILLLYLYQQYTMITNKMGSVLCNFQDPLTISGLLTGIVISFFFASLANNGVRKAAISVMDDVRDQFLGFLEKQENKVKEENETQEENEIYVPDYNRTIIKLTMSAFKQMILPVLLPFISIILSILIGYLYYKCLLTNTTSSNINCYSFKGSIILMNMVTVGILLGGSVLSLFLTVSGGAWDNAKKYLEVINKGSEQHKAAITGDTVGDPFKDTSGPSMNSLIKITSILSIIGLYIVNILLDYC